MNKLIAIPLVLYVISIIVSFVFPYYISVGPFIFMLVLLVVMVYRKQQVDMTQAIEQERSKLIIYSATALILAPIFVGLLLALLK